MPADTGIYIVAIADYHCERYHGVFVWKRYGLRKYCVLHVLYNSVWTLFIICTKCVDFIRTHASLCITHRRGIVRQFETRNQQLGLVKFVQNHKLLCR